MTPSAATSLASVHRPITGVLWMIASGIAFIGVNGIVRHLGTDLPSAQSAFIRYAIGVVMLLPFLAKAMPTGLTKGTWAMILSRGVVHSAAVLFWFFAMARIPVAHVTAIGYLSPVILVVAGGFLLREGLTLRRMVAVCVAFAGALVVLRPGWQPVTLGHASQIAAAICFAGSYLLAKQLSQVLPAFSVVILMSLTVTVGLMPIALWVWEPVSWMQVGWLAIVALIATLGHYFMTRAFEVAPLTVTQPVTFLQLIWATIVGWIVFGEPVDAFVLVGGAMIMGAISWVTWFEVRKDVAQ